MGWRSRNESYQRVLQRQICADMVDHLRITERAPGRYIDALLHDRPHREDLITVSYNQGLALRRELTKQER